MSKIQPIQSMDDPNKQLDEKKREQIIKRHKKIMKFAYENNINNSSIQVNPIKSMNSLKKIHSKPIPNINIQDFDKDYLIYKSKNPKQQELQQHNDISLNQQQQQHYQQQYQNQNNKDNQNLTLKINNKKVLSQQQKPKTIQKPKKYYKSKSPLCPKTKKFSPMNSLQKAQNFGKLQQQKKLYLQNSQNFDNISEVSTSHQISSLNNFKKKQSQSSYSSSNSIFTPQASARDYQETPLETEQSQQIEPPSFSLQQQDIYVNQDLIQQQENNVQEEKDQQENKQQNQQDIKEQIINQQKEVQNDNENININNNNQGFISIDINQNESQNNNENELADNDKFCRICKDEDIPEPLIAPCACTGSVKYVHHSCLHQWVSQNINDNHMGVPQQNNFICEICKQKYAVVEINYCSLSDALKNKHERGTVKFSLFCIFLCTIILSFLTFLLINWGQQGNFLSDMYILISILCFFTLCIIIGNLVTLFGSMQQFKWKFSDKITSGINELTLPKMLQIQKDITINKLYTNKDNKIEKLKIDQHQCQQVIDTECYDM